MKYLFFCVLTLSVFSCNNSPADQAVKSIRELESNKNLAQSDSLINSYIRFADNDPAHDSSIAYLFKAASLSLKTSKVPKGARLYERVAMEYKNDSIAPKALIRAATAFASIPDPANAKRLYDYFIATYPTHPRIEEVKMWSVTSGMTEDELLRFFKEKIEKKDSNTL